MRVIAWIAVVVAMVAGAGAQTPPAERRVALVIGNSTYQHMGRLANPRNDATAMARQLAEMGFEVVGNGPQLDLDHAAMTQAIRDFGRTLRGAATGLFYYAGHGVQVRNRNFLVPINARIDTENEIALAAIDANLALEQLEASGARLSIIVLDACRNNPFPGSQFRSIGAGLAQMQAAAGTVISFAAQPGAMALDGPADGNSPYTAALLEAMRRPGLNVLDVFNEVGVTVSRATGRSQQPWVSSSPIEGRFFFTPGVDVGAPQTPDQNAIELAYWNAVQGSRSVAALNDYLRRYPNGQFVSLARVQIAELGRAPPPQPAARPIQVSPPPPAPQAQAQAPPQAAQAPAPRALTQVFVGTPTTPDTDRCGSFGPLTLRITDGRISGAVTATSPRQGSSIAWTVSGTLGPGGEVVLRFATDDPRVVDVRRRSLSMSGRLRGDVIEAAQGDSAGGCGRSVRLTRR